MSMSTLSELYITMESLRKLNLPIEDRLKEEAAKLEEDLIRTEILPTLTDKIEPALAQVQRELVLVVDYIPGQPLKVSLSRKRNIADVLTDAVEISPKRTHVVTATDIVRSTSVPFTVTFDDGHVSSGSGKDTLIDALKHMMLPMVATFDQRTFADFPLVGRRQRVTGDGTKWQENVDGWWIYTCMSNDVKMEVIHQVADFLGVNVTIKSSDQIVTPTPHQKPNGKRAMFSLNGGAPLNKRNAVFAAIKLFMQQNPWATFEEIDAFFPRHLQGGKNGYGVVAPKEEYDMRYAKGQDVNIRYFINKPLVDPNGRTFFVCNQWGDNFAAFQQHVKDEFGWTLEEL